MTSLRPQLQRPGGPLYRGQIQLKRGSSLAMRGRSRPSSSTDPDQAVAHYHMGAVTRRKAIPTSAKTSATLFA